VPKPRRKKKKNKNGNEKKPKTLLEDVDDVVIDNIILRIKLP